ncbi:TonB-dependent receptor [Luteimonas sp. XNQY3]|nr:TonB-dependent receptor [Luteimonas sp. XNQY3]MCD9006333.1 TonB-dependent receptor [Luteimonas sp. XNQY3]
MKQAQARSTKVNKGIVRTLYAGVIATGLCLSVSATAQAPPTTTVAFDIPSQPLSAALKTFADQAGMQLLYRTEAVGNATARPVQGQMDRREALRQLLEGTGLEVIYSADDAATIRPTYSTPSGEEQKNVRQVKAAVSPEALGMSAAAVGTAAARTGSASTTMDTVMVTGTRIRGGTTPSPVITIGSERIQEEGFADLGEVIRSVSQNFSGGQNPGVLSGNLAGAGNANQNMTGGSALNLRGLGADATLTLLNGRRMAYGGYTQSVDISAIPLDAVERIEIVADGASAIYGSDAVGGVGNVVLKRDYNGVGVGTRFGSATQGGLSTREYTVTAGSTWASGGLIATYKDASVDPIYTDRRAYTEQLVDPSTLYPGSDLRSGLLSAHQAVGDAVELRVDALRTERDQMHLYNWAGRHSRVTPSTTSTLVAPGIDVWLPNDWSLSLSGAFGRGTHDQYRRETVVASGAVSIIDQCYCNESRSYELGAEGPVFALPAGDARVAAGVGYRRNTFQNLNNPTGAVIMEERESAHFAYAEIDLPVIGEGQGMRGIERLSLTAAVRREDYSSFGGVTTPKLGLIYAPGADLTLKASWGKSFKAPTLFERSYAASAYVDFASAFGGGGAPADATVLVLNGGNSDLDPERARTTSVSLAYHPQTVSGLDAELTWFQVDYRDRVIQPLANPTQAMSDPIYAPFVQRDPSAAAQASLIAGADAFYNFTGAPYDPAGVVAIIHTEYANVAQQDIRGVDLSGSYRLAFASGTLTLRGSTSWLDSTQQTIPDEAPFDLSGTLFNPPKLSSRVGGVWSRGGLSASMFGNYRGGVTNRLDGVKSASFTTLDATVRYATSDRGDLWAGMEFAFSIDNALDRDPPLYQVASPLYAAPYDSTNYSPIGRFLSLAISKRW